MEPPKLKDTTVSLAARYESFLKWLLNQNNQNIEYLASILQVEPGIVDLFFRLGEVEPEEYEIISKEEIDIDILVLIIYWKKAIRYRIYSKIGEFLSLPQPATAVREFVEENIIGTYESMLQEISVEYWNSIVRYLKDRNITGGAFSPKFRSMLVGVIRKLSDDETISQGQLDWIAQAIICDHDDEMGVFFSANAKKKFPKDCLKIKEILELIKGLVSV